MITVKENIAHNARLNNTLKETENNAAAFALFLSMLHPDITKYSRISTSDSEHELSYSSMEKGAYRSSRKYARPDDYMQANALNNALHQVKNPTLLLGLYQCFFPQALHYAGEQQNIPDDILENTAFYTEHPSSLVEDDILLSEEDMILKDIDKAQNYTF